MTALQKPFEPETNKLLAALPKRERDHLLPHLKPVVLEFEQVLYEPDKLIRHVYFPTSGLISLLLVLEDGSVAEVSRVGNEGMVGLPVFLGVQTSHTRACVQIPGQALRMKAPVFRREARQGGALRGLLLRYTQASLRHVSQLTACNNHHSIEQRLCRWLLITHDRVQAEQFEITQEFLSQTLGVHRQSVTLGASNLQRAGLIRYSRGKLTILDRRGLEAASCECYGAVRRVYESLFA
jgi:CRP-like cAMP-binding protein